MSEATEEKKEENEKEIKKIIITNEYNKQCNEAKYNINNFYQLYKELKDKDPLIQFKGLVGMKKLCKEEKKKENPKKLFNVLINNLIIFIKDYPETFQYESLICLKNIEKINLSLEGEAKIVDNGIIILVLSRIKSRKELNMEKMLLKVYLSYIKTIVDDTNSLIEMLSGKIIDEAINIINDYMKDDDLIIVNECLKIFFNLLLNREDFDLKDFFQEKNKQNSKKPEDIIKIVIDIMNNHPDKNQIMQLCLKIIELFSHEDSENLDILIELNILPKIIELIDSPNGDIIFLALKIIGNFVMNENNIYTQIIIDLNALDKLKKTLKREYDNLNKDIRKESSFAVSNIAAGTQDQLIKLYENDFYDVLVDIIKNDEENSCKNNCLWALYNFSCIKNHHSLQEIVQKGFIRIIIDRFHIDCGEVLGCSLEALYNILEFGKKIENPVSINFVEKEIKDLDIFNAVKQLKESNNEEICQEKTKAILNTFCRVSN